jgi:diguanylate cyclase (GGDEF)-like protein
MRPPVLNALRDLAAIARRRLLLRLDQPEAARARDAVLHARVALAAAPAAAAMVAWIAVDALVFPWDRTAILALGRLATGAALAWLAARAGRLPPRRALALLFAIPLAFYGWSLATLWTRPSGGDFLALVSAYEHLPFLAAVGVALFPLTVVECAVVVGPWVAVAAVVGALRGDWDGGVLSPGLLWLLGLVGAVAAVAAANQLQFLADLVAQSSRDALTGALTRGVGLELLIAQLAQAERREAPLGVVFLDLDRFKSINDAYGHGAGDAVLSAAAARIRTVLRRQDSLIRWGGEEFVLLLPGTDRAGLHSMVARLAAYGLGQRPDGAPVTASLGLAERRQDGANEAARLVALADARMYRAKQDGRNRVYDGSGTVPFVAPQVALSAA